MFRRTYVRLFETQQAFVGQPPRKLAEYLVWILAQTSRQQRQQPCGGATGTRNFTASEILVADAFLSYADSRPLFRPSMSRD